MALTEGFANDGDDDDDDDWPNGPIDLQRQWGEDGQNTPHTCRGADLNSGGKTNIKYKPKDTNRKIYLVSTK